MAIKGKKIFLTGGAGFIGVNLIFRLIKDNQIIVYDNLRRNALKYTNLLEKRNLRLVKADILDTKSLKDSIRGSDIVIHLAAIAGTDTVIKSPTTTMKVNMIGTANILEATKSLKNCQRFIDFSTSEVFGIHCYNVQEDDPMHMGSVGGARWTYAVGKLSGEHLTYSYYKEFNLPIVIIRPFNIYGPRQVGEGAVHRFIEQVLMDCPIEIFGTGNRIRSWCYIDDFIEGVLLCLENNDISGQIFNIGSPRDTITVHSLANLILRISKSKSTIKFLPDNKAEVELRVPNIDKAKRILGFDPKIELEEGLHRTIEWYKMKRDNNAN